MYPPNPNMLLRMFDGGKSSIIAALVFGFGLGYVMGKGDKKEAERFWRDRAESYHHEHRHSDREHEREHERDSHRKHYER
jgi:hypothetical protein